MELRQFSEINFNGNSSYNVKRNFFSNSKLYCTSPHTPICYDFVIKSLSLYIFDQSESEDSDSLEVKSSVSTESLILLCTSSCSSSLSSFSLSSDGPVGGSRCVGSAGSACRTGRQRPPTSSQPCPSGDGWFFMEGWRTTYAK